MTAPALQQDNASRIPLLLESLALLLLGIAVMSYLYAASAPLPGDEVGAPGHDSFYHTKMAALLPQVGLVDTFPWLRFAYFRQAGDAFVSHHYGFHVVLAPFVYAAKWLTGDYLPGGRWAISTFFGLNLLLFNLLLRAGGVRQRWLWIGLFLLLPHQFFARHAFIRAIGISLVCMQFLVLMLMQRRYIWAGVAIAAYVHVYLGAVMYAPVIVVLFALAEVASPAGERHWPWRMAAWTLGGWLLGVLTYPYFDGMIEFLRLQVLGTGLAPDIEVGREWLPYTDPWWFAKMSAIVLSVWVAAFTLRLRFGPRLSSTETAILLVNLAFLILTLKARRFIEYWPPFCLLNAAQLASPVLAAAASRWSAARQPENRGTWQRFLPWTLTLAGVAAAALLLWYVGGRGDTQALLAEWPVWALLLGLIALTPLTEIWARRDENAPEHVPYARLFAIPAGGLALIAAVAAFAYATGAAESLTPRLALPAWSWPALAAVYLAIAPFALLARRGVAPMPFAAATRRTINVVAVVLLGFGGLLHTAHAGFRSAAADTRCMYDLPAIRDMMAFLQANSQPGDVIFTDDWDIFPVYFYHNHYNHYIVGLDPKFTHERRPDLWERYVRISRGEIPTTSRVRLAAHDGGEAYENLDIQLADIRTEFGARYVICDRDHRGLAVKLSRTRQLAELVYPGTDFNACRDAPFLVFRMRDPGEPLLELAAAQPDAQGRLFLGQLEPLAVDQGWGQLVTNATVEHRGQQMRGQNFVRGLGTHAPSKLLYEVPSGFDFFEAVVGVDDETSGLGSIVAAVYLDGEKVFESPTLTGDSDPAVVRIELGNARQLLLEARTTEDGNRFDHVNWSEAHLARGMTRVTAADADKSRGAAAHEGQK